MRSPRLILFVCLLSALAACDSGSDELESGRYQLTLTGQFENSLDGRATFQTGLGTDEFPTLAITMTTPLGARGASILIRESAANAPGTVSVGLEDADAYVLYSDISGDALFYPASSGTLTLTVVEADRIAGTFSGTLIDSDTEMSVGQISGEFDAVRVELTEDAP